MMASEEMARLLCKADGFDPDQHVMAHRAVEHGAHGHIVVRFTVPSWCLYQKQALHAMSALDMPVKT